MSVFVVSLIIWLIVYWGSRFFYKIVSSGASRPHTTHTGGGDQIDSNVFNLRLSAHDYQVSALFLAMGIFAKAKGRVEIADINFAEKVMNTMGLGDDLKGVAQQVFNYGKDRPELMQPLLEEINFKVSNSMLMLRELFDVCMGMLKDENPQQVYLLKLIASFAHMTQAEFETRMHMYGARSRQSHSGGYSGGYQQYGGYNYNQYGGGQRSSPRTSSQSSLAKAYKLFDITDPSSLTKDDLKKRYRRLIKKYHPDHYSSDENKALYDKALRKTQEINVAYDEICEAKGFPKN